MGNEKYKEDKEYDKLRREYRNMEVNRKTLAEENQNVLRRQHQSLNKLRTENENLKTDVATIQARTTMKPLNQFEQNQLDNVTQEIQRYTSLNEAMKNEVSTMKDNISNLKDELWHRRRKMGGSNAAIENYQNIERQIKTLESKVDQATFKLNQTLAANRSLREDIDSLREERISFEGVYKKVEKQLQECKEQMAQIIEKSNFAYEQRDKARMEILAIEQSMKNEQESFDMQMEEMGQKLEEEIKAVAERRKLQHPNEFDSTEEDRAKLIAEQAAKEQMLIEEKEAAAKERDERIKQFEDTLKEIEAVTGISAVEDLVKMWKENEEHNYSLFKFANQQQNEAEDLKEELNSFQLQQQDGMIGDESPLYPEETMECLNHNITMNTKLMNSLDLKLNECDNLLGIMKEGVKMLMLRLDCKVTNEISDLNVSEANILDYMALIEEKATSILKEYHSLVEEGGQQPPMKGQQENGEKVEDFKDSGSRTSREHKNRSSREYQQVRDLQLTSSGQDQENRKSCLNPPKLIEYYSGDEQISDTDGDNARPLYGDELKERTLHRMSYSQEQHDTTKERSYAGEQPAPPPMIMRNRGRRRGSSTILSRFN